MDAKQPEENGAQKPLCGAKLRNKNATCRRAPAEGRTRCRLHGGATPRGVNSPHFKTGYLSAQLPARLMARMVAAMEDGDLHSLRKDIAFVSARVDETLQRLVDDHDASTTWQKLLLQRDAFVASQDNEERGAIIREMFELIARAERELAVFDEVHKLIDQRANLIKKDTERQLKLSQGVTLDQVTLYFQALTSAVREIVDQETLGKIYEAFERINARSARLRLVAQIS